MLRYYGERFSTVAGCVATAVQGEGCDLFWPCIDHPQGEPLQVDQHISVPAPLVAAGNGIAVGPGRYFE